MQAEPETERPAASPQNLRVAVIGAGAAGLTALKVLLEAGLQPLAFEQRPGIGGLWDFDEALPDGGSPGYRSLKTNTSKKMTAFSDFPFPENAPDFPSRQQVLEYLHSYAAHFNLLPCVRFNTTVERLQPDGSGKWRLTYRSAAGQESRVFDAVVVASGFYRRPVMPEMPGLETFQGCLLHSGSYKDAVPFEGRRVVIIGSSSSAADISAEVSRVAGRVELSARSGVWFSPHLEAGRPVDLALSRFRRRIPARAAAASFRKLLLRNYARMGFSEEQLETDLRLPRFEPGRTRITRGTHALEQIRAGKIRLRPDVERVLPDGVVFTDGSRVTADSLVLCTGYAADLPFLDPGVIQVEDNDRIRLYRHVFHPEYSSLAFIGMCRVNGPVLPVMEMQARWAAQVWRGQARLPEPDRRRQSIQARFEAAQQREDNPMRVAYASYMEAIAAEIGVRPRLLRHPRLLPKLLFGPLVAAQYRLDGPGKSENAARIIAGA